MTAQLNNSRVWLEGLTQRGKNRIKEHGQFFELIDRKPNSILVRCVGTHKALKGPWMGWLNSSEVREIEVGAFNNTLDHP